jgi:hypothetical protein
MTYDIGKEKNVLLWGYLCPFCMLLISFFMGTKLIIQYPFFVCKAVGQFVGMGKFTVSKLTLKG